jgi:hypothetical protein
MASPLEMLQLGQSFDPYGSFRQGGMEGQKYDIEQQKLDIQQAGLAQQQKEIDAEQKQPTGAAPLSNMAKSLLPPTYQLATPDGIPTAAGLFNQQAVNSQQDLSASAKIMQQARFMEPGSKEQINAISEARRLQTAATINMGNAKKEYQKSIDDGLESLYGASSQGEYDQRLKDALGRTGIPLPANFPETWSPDVRQKLLSLMTPEARNRVEKEDRARRDEQRKEKSAELRDAKLIAALQGGGKESPAASRVLQAFTQASDALTNVARLPITTTGPMFQQKQFNSLLTAPLSALNQEMSDTTSQKMQTRMVGVARSLASLESGGAATGLVGLANSIESGVAIPAGAKLDVAMDKLAEMRRIVESSSEAQLSDKNLSEERKNLIRSKLELVRKAIPFTQEQLDAASNAAKENPDLTFTEFATKQYGAPKAKGTGTKEDPIKLD